MDSTLPELVGLQVAPDAMMAIDSDGRIVLVNPQTERLFGYRAAELLRRPADHLVSAIRAVHPHHLGRLRPATAGVSRVQAGVELLGRRKDGSTFPAELSLSSVGPDEAPMTLTAIRDLTEWRRPAAPAASLAALVASSHDALIASSTTGVITGWNPAAARLYGYPAEEMIGRTVHRLFQTRDDREVDQLWRQAVSTGRVETRLLAHRHRDGSAVPVMMTLTAIIGPRGGVIGVAAVSRDAAERRRAEVTRLDSLAQLAGGVAHDFNNLLAVILSYTSLVAEEVSGSTGGPDTDRVDPRWTTMAADLDQIRGAAERAGRLTRQLLTFGRREVARPEVLDLAAVLDGLRPTLEATLGERVRLRTDLEPSPHPVRIDAEHLEQALIHLATNAAEAMSDGGTLTVETRNVTVDPGLAGDHGGDPQVPVDVPSGRYVRLRVADTGAGMSSEVLEHAFEPFFSTKQRGQGRGLGLAAVHGILTQAGGYLRLASTPGRGTTVVAWLPATAPALPAERAGHLPAQRGGGETILLVEDTAPLREATRRILRQAGYQVLDCADGKTAAQAVAAHEGPIHLLLTDVMMPDTLGTEVAERVRQQRPGVRVVFMSGYAHPVLASEGTLAEGVILVEKPFTEAVLLRTVREVLER